MRRLSAPRAFAMVALAAAALVAASCGSHSADHEESGAPTTTIPARASFNAADVRFAQGMIPHHQQAVEMATLATRPEAKASPEVADLARRIASAQEPEITQMETWLTRWGQPREMDDHAGHDSMPGMMGSADMAELGALSGTAFDARFRSMMIAHHRGALTMANEVLAGGKSPEVKRLAREIVTAQQAEIDEMSADLP